MPDNLLISTSTRVTMSTTIDTAINLASCLAAKNSVEHGPDEAFKRLRAASYMARHIMNMLTTEQIVKDDLEIIRDIYKNNAQVMQALDIIDVAIV